MEIENLHIRETFINESKGYQCGRTDVHEAFTDDVGHLFRSLQKEYGRCMSRIYIDRPDGRAVPVGWVFEKRVQYEDSGRHGRAAEYYTQAVWVELHAGPPEITRREHLINLEKGADYDRAV